MAQVLDDNKAHIRMTTKNTNFQPQRCQDDYIPAVELRSILMKEGLAPLSEQEVDELLLFADPATWTAHWSHFLPLCFSGQGSGWLGELQGISEAPKRRG